mmetsp:Transcript_68185/g.142492  ORF Transcript_68185/g.142492 Transcript_68185/m.142492 type:complete len:531 (+) Transcript_68185:136-1728(+)
MQPQRSQSGSGDPDALKYDAETGLAVPRLAIFLVFVTIFMDTLAATISTPALPYYAREFGANAAQIGYLFVAWSFASTFCAPCLGRASDRFGRRTVLLVSLIGAGVANLGQASAGSYPVLFCWRGFSGIWAAVSATANVYLTDVCSPEVRDDYMSKLAAMPSLAMIFGPGLGGGLSTFGLNFPILADGCLSLGAAFLVFLYLPESPAWRDGSSGATNKTDQDEQVKEPVGWRVYLLGLSGFLYGNAFGTRVSMQVVSLNVKLGLSPLQVGYTFVAFAIVTLGQTIWLQPWMQRKLGAFSVAFIGSVVQGVFMPVGFALADGLWPTLLCLVIANVGSTARMAASGPLSASLAGKRNRGAVFGLVQMMTNFGRMVGPLVAGQLAMTDAVVMPWLFFGVNALVSGLLLLPLLQAVSKPLDEQERRRRLRGFTDLLLAGEEGESAVEDDKAAPVPSSEDISRLGDFMAELLSRKNYPWVTHQQSVFSMLDRVLPPLRSRKVDKYQDLELLDRHAEHMKNEFCKLGGDRQMGTLL